MSEVSSSASRPRSSRKPPRFFIEGVHAVDEWVTLSASESHKLLHVLRLGIDDEVTLIDSAARTYLGRIIAIDGAVQIFLAELLADISAGENSLRLTLAQAIPKGQKMDFVVEKATELGVMRIIPFTSERTAGYEIGSAKLDRWRRLATTAAQQCGRTSVPQIDALQTWDAFLASFTANDDALILFPWEIAEPFPLAERLPSLLETRRDVTIVIGPEGGFSHREAEAARAHGAVHISLGKRIFRTETAGLVLASILMYAVHEI